MERIIGRVIAYLFIAVSTLGFVFIALKLLMAIIGLF